MDDSEDVNTQMLWAVNSGDIEKARQLINTYGLSYSKGWSKGYVLLRDALKNGHTEIAKFLLTKTSKVNSSNLGSVDTPLHFAVQIGDVEIIKTLLDKGARIDAEDSNGRTPLYYAIRTKKMKNEIIELLLKYGPDVNARNDNGYCLLHLVVAAGDLQLAELLLTHGALINCQATTSSGSGNGYTPLHVAAEKGNKEGVTFLISRGADLNASDGNSLTPLHIAAKEGKEEIVELFLNKGVDVDVVGKESHSTPLHSAIESGQTKVMVLLLEKGAKVDNKDKEGRTVLNLAVVERESLTNVQHILKYCPDVNCQSNKRSLTTAATSYSKSDQIVRTLLDYGFTVDPTEANNSKLFHSCVERGYVEIVEDLLKYGADVNTLHPSDYKAPLQSAVINNQEKVADLLIKYGADVNSKDKAGKPPIYHAIVNADANIFKLLLTNGADVKNTPEIFKPELLNTVVEKKSTEIVRFLLENDVSVNDKDLCGRTALHFTAVDGQEDLSFKRPFAYPGVNESSDANGEIAKLLLARGAKVDAQTKNGVTTLHGAAQKGYTKVVEALLEHNANVNLVANNGTTPLHLSALRGNKDITTLLLSKGAYVNSKEEDGNTALHIAAEKGYAELVKELLKYGAKVYSKNQYGYTPLHMCAGKGHLKTVETVLEFGADINTLDDFKYTALNYTSNGRRLFNKYDKYQEYNNRRQLYYETFYVSREKKKITEILKRHILQMKTAGLYVSKLNLLSIGDLDEMAGFKNECEEELALMKTEKIGSTDISFYDILRKGSSSLTMCLMDEDVVRVLKSKEYAPKFPIYAKMIENRFKKGMDWKEAYGIFYSHFNPKLPYECIEKIFIFLSDEDLGNFIDVQLQHTNS